MKVLIIVAHADDEALGCGGAIAKHVKAGDDVSIIFMTNGVSSRNEADTEYKDITNRELAKKASLKILGINKHWQLNFPDNKMDIIPLLEIVQQIEPIIKEVFPEIIYTHFAFDLNIDHQITHSAVMTASRPQLNSSVKKILSFEVLSSSEWGSPYKPRFSPQYFINISDEWETKLKALKCYDLEMRKPPHSRSYQCIEALAIFRGETNGFNKAEAFQVERILEY